MQKTFKQFLVERDLLNDDELSSVKHIYNMIMASAPNTNGQFLDNVGFLVRAVYNPGDLLMQSKVGNFTLTLYEKPIRQDRKPLTTTAKDNAVINDVLEDLCGERIRERGVFTAAGIGKADSVVGYGSIIGIVLASSDNARLSWADDVADLTSDVIENVGFDFVEDAVRALKWNLLKQPKDIGNHDGEVVMTDNIAKSYLFLTIEEDGKFVASNDYLTRILLNGSYDGIMD